MLDLLLSAGGGGVLGLVGAGFKSFMGWKEKKLTLQHELDLARETRLTMGVEIQLAKLQGEIELEQTEVTADASNLNAALQAEASITGTSQWVTDLRGSTRPVPRSVTGLATGRSDERGRVSQQKILPCCLRFGRVSLSITNQHH